MSLSELRPAAASVAIANCSSRLSLECPVGINAEVRYFIVLLILHVAIQRIIIIEDGTLRNAVACASRERAHAFFSVNLLPSLCNRHPLMDNFHGESTWMPRVIAPFEWRLRSFLHRRPDDLGGAIEQKNPICFFYRCYYRFDKSRGNRRRVGRHRTRKKSIFQVKFISCRRGKGTRGKNVSARLNKWLLNNFLLRNFYFAIFRYYTLCCLTSDYKWILIKKIYSSKEG